MRLPRWLRRCSGCWTDIFFGRQVIAGCPRHGTPPDPHGGMTQEEYETWLDQETCESCLARGWHFVAFSGDLHAWKESCLVPGVVEVDQEWPA